MTFVRPEITTLADSILDADTRLSGGPGHFKSSLVGFTLLYRAVVGTENAAGARAPTAYFSPLEVSVDGNSCDYADPVPLANVLLFFVVAFIIVCSLIAINWIIVNFRSNNKKNSPYECGFEPVGSPVADFTPNFTAVALIFLIYDVEVLLTFPWAYSMAGRSALALVVFTYFIVIMLLGLAYEIIDESFNVV